MATSSEDKNEESLSKPNFLQEVMMELRKCTWPTWAELRQSSVVVIVSFLILGAFVALSDVFLTWLLLKPF